MSREEFEAKTEEWHNEDWDSLNEIELHEYMGITWEQYSNYIEEGFND